MDYAPGMQVTNTLTEGIDYGTTLPETLWHYTGSEALANILQSKELWATNCLYLNDASEFIFSARVIASVLDEVIDEETTTEVRTALVRLQELVASAHPLVTPPLYIVSFAGHRDRLSLWRGYRKAGDTINVGLDGFTLWGRGMQSWQLRECFYDDDRQRIVIRDVLQRCIERLKAGGNLHHVLLELAFDVAWLAPILKHPKFEEEQEWRMIRYPPHLVRFPEDSEPVVRQRPRSRGPIPYIGFPLAMEAQQPEVQITLGPGAKLTETDVLAMAEANAVSATVGVSEIPFRDDV